MKKIIGFSATILIAFLGHSQSQPELSLHSKCFAPSTSFFLMDIKRNETRLRTSQIKPDYIKNIKQKYALFEHLDKIYVNAFILVADQIDTNQLLGLGVKIKAHLGKIITASIPIDRLEMLAEIPGVVSIQIGEKVQISMDEARKVSGMDEVHEGLNLPQSYWGKDVVIGIIDAGFDYTHPTFYDESGTNNYRIKRVWEQSTNGTHPPGFAYGRELKTQNSILSSKYDIIDQSHGTHVSGIAAGSGGTQNSKNRGVALGAELVLVSFDHTETGIADGIQYIMDYAESVGKPCVINLSIEYQLGPHDGTSFLNQFQDAMVGPGRLIVNAAGNYGDRSGYLQKTFSPSNNVLFSFLEFEDTSLGTNGSLYIDIWGDPTKNFGVRINNYNLSTKLIEDQTEIVYANEETSKVYTLYDHDASNPDPSFIYIYPGINPLNTKPHIEIFVDNTLQDDEDHWIQVEVLSEEGTTRMWLYSTMYKGLLSNKGMASPVLSGTSTSSVNDFATCISCISVGSFNSRIAWTDLAGNDWHYENRINKDISAYSSKGPTTDGRIKPDITAPGSEIISAISSFDTRYSQDNLYVVDKITKGNKDWLFAVFSGTSMAAPMVTGTLALWLEAYPKLTQEQARALLKASAKKDQFTGPITSSGSNTWGWGKLQTHQGMMSLIAKIPEQPTINAPSETILCSGHELILSASGNYHLYEWSNGATGKSFNILEEGNYQVRGIDIDGYIGPWSEVVHVTKKDSPPTPVVSLNEFVLTSNALESNQWFLNGEPILNATDPNFIASQNGYYYVRVTNEHGCFAESNNIHLIVTGIEAPHIEEVTKVYPNPTSHDLTLTFHSPEKKVGVDLYDSQGRKIWTDVLHSIESSKVEKLNVPDLRDGIYMLSVSTPHSHETFKIIVLK